VWNGYSQEHHSMVATQSNDAMVAYWQGNGFKEVILVDAKDFDDANQPGAYVDSTAFSLPLPTAGLHPGGVSGHGQGRKICPRRHPDGADREAVEGGRGPQAGGQNPHNLYPGDSLEKDYIVDALTARAPHPRRLGSGADQL
jgi:hypothetical protein